MVVGAGFAGSVVAERLASSGERIVVIDRRDHLAGNAYDHTDARGVLIHRYGPHAFHTNDRRVFEYLSRFTHWRFYEHRVRAQVGDRLLPIPINRTTLNSLYGLDLKSEADAAAYFERVRTIREVKTSEDHLLSSVGRDLMERFFSGYSLKQWGTNLSELSPSVVARIPYRTNDDDRYFTDAFQFMPTDGFTPLFRRMLDHPNIKVILGSPWDGTGEWEHIVWTGAIDEFFGFSLGKLPYRSLSFEHHQQLGRLVQPVAQINFPSPSTPYTRSVEWRHMTGQDHPWTAITLETPRASGEPFYPVPSPAASAIYRGYEELAAQTPRVSFVGRLAQYRYYNMDQTIAAALKVAAALGA